MTTEERAAPYIDFLKSKIKIAPDTGIEFKAEQVNPILKPHERDTVLWAAKGGQRAIFSSFGLGKTLTQLDVLRLIMGEVADLAQIYSFERLETPVLEKTNLFARAKRKRRMQGSL